MPSWTMVNCLHCGARSTVIGNWIPHSSSVKCWSCGALLGAWHEAIQQAETTFSKGIADGAVEPASDQKSPRPLRG